MKSTLATAAVISTLFLLPSIVYGEETNATVEAEVTTQTPEKPRPLIAPPPIKKIIQNAASTTRAGIKEQVDAAQGFIDKRKAEVKNLIDTKPRGEISSTTAAEREAKREEMRRKLEEKKAATEDRIEAAREKAREKFGEAVQTSVGNIIDRLTKHAERLTSIAQRIDDRIKEHQSQGADMSVSLGLLADARVAIAAAQDKIAAVGTALTAALSAENPKEEMPKVRSAVKAAEDALKAAKEALHKVLESVRAEAEVSSSAEADVSAGTN